MNFELFVAFRYLKAKRKQAFISLISVISVIGVALGVMALITVISVMGGFEAHWRSKLLGINSHVIVRNHMGSFSDYQEIMAKIKDIKLEKKISGGFWDKISFKKPEKDILAITPLIYIQGLLSGGGGVSGVIIRGIEPETYIKVAEPGLTIEGHGIDSLGKHIEKDSLPSIIMGVELAKNLNVSVGQNIQLILPTGTITPVGMMPKIRGFKVTGTISSGVYDYDASLAFIGLKDAQKLLGIGDMVQGIELKVSDIYSSNLIVNKITDTLPNEFWATDWQKMSRNLFAALKLEKLGLFIVLTLIVLVAAFNIISTLIMMVMEKAEDIAVLKALGAKDNQILRIFMLNGSIIGFLGTFIGVLGGIGLCSLLKKYKFIEIPADVYFTDKIPVLLNPADVVIIALSAIIICFLATIYPSRQAARVKPSEILRTG